MADLQDSTAPDALTLAQDMLQFLTSEFLDRHDYEQMESDVRAFLAKATGTECPTAA